MVRILLLVLLLSACGGPPANIVGIAPEPLGTPVDIILATSRAEATDPAILFSGERGDDLSFARVSVFVPPERPVGTIPRPRTLPPDPRRQFVIGEPQRLAGGAAFVAAVDSAIATRPSPSVLVFVHGFNTDLTSALLLTAQFVHDSGFSGVPVLYSWPSRGRALSYVYDMNSVLQSRDGLVETSRLLARTRAQKFDVLAHSLGSLLVLEALRDMALTGKFAAPPERLDNVMLASPDVDIDVFAAQLSQIGPVPIYVLAASTDRALGLSRLIAGGVSRAGNADPDALAALGVTVLDVSAVRERDFVQHTQFTSVPAIVELIGGYMQRTGGFADDEERTGLRSALVQATLLPARIVGGGRVFVAVE